MRCSKGVWGESLSDHQLAEWLSAALLKTSLSDSMSFFSARGSRRPAAYINFTHSSVAGALWKLFTLHRDSCLSGQINTRRRLSGTINTSKEFNHDGWWWRLSPLCAGTLSPLTQMFRHFQINNSCFWVCVHIVLKKPLELFNTNCLYAPERIRSERQKIV